MERIEFIVGIDEPIKRFVYQDIKVQSVESKKATMNAKLARAEDYYEVEYPVRTNFLKENNLENIQYESEGFNNIYTPYERDKINFSTFISTPHKIYTYAKLFIEAPESGVFNFLIKTCGGTVMWVNGQRQFTFTPYTRNHGSEKNCQLSFNKGVNEMVIYFEDLAERDVEFFFEIINKNTIPLKGYIPISYDRGTYLEIEEVLEEAYLEKDIFRSGDIKVHFPNIPRDNNYELRIKVNPKENYLDTEAQDGNITDFKVNDINLLLEKNVEALSIGNVSDIPSAGFTKFELGIEISQGIWITRNLCCSIYNEEFFEKIITENTIENRKSQAIEYFSELDLEDINVALSKVYLNKAQNLDLYKSYLSAFKLIEEKGDCADFILTPLLAVYTKYPQNFPMPFHKYLKEMSLNFRYWFDEPGNDVMWYFSENHALLFHVSQYLSGYLFPEDNFTVSSRLGKKQYEIGKQRLVEWFDQFFKYGFSEWNSTTYFPIDFIGFLSLYIAAPDEEIKELAKKSLDYTFKLIAINYHGGTMTSTFGRVYEHNLKAMPLGEISNVIQIIWKKGYFNNSLRASALLAMTDYEPPKELFTYLCTQSDKNIEATYLQGENRACTYLFKNIDYSLATAVHYRPFERGHQQHIINISLGNSTVLWLTNPGESEFSGNGRPSYWAGNDVMPDAFQYKNLAFLRYKLKASDYKYIHLYLPYWELDEVIEDDNWVFIRKGDAYLAVFFTNPYKRTWSSSVYGREIIANGENQCVVVKCSSKSEGGRFEEFIQKIKIGKLDFREEKITFKDFQYGNIEFDENLWVNGQPINYPENYDLKIYNLERGTEE